MQVEGELLGTVEHTLPEVLGRRGSGCAVVDGGRTLSYPDLREGARSVARRLVGLGVEPGDRVALLLSNRLEFLFAYFGALLAGAVAVPINTRFSRRELGAVLSHCGAKAAVAEESFRRVPLRSRLLELQRELPGLRHVLPAETLESAGKGSGNAPLPGRRPDDPAVLIYTSGTTGRPKGCLHAHRSFVNSARVTAESKGLGPSDRVLASVPFFNVFGSLNCILESAWAGARIVVQRAFDAGDALEWIERERVTVFLGTPTMWIRLREHPAFSPRRVASLRTGIMAGARAPRSLVGDWRSLGCDVRVTYGMSELPSILENGRPTPNTSVRVDESGAVWARGPSRMLEYFRDPCATEERIVEGWVGTGDLATADTSGALEIVGRADDMMIVGGFNVQPGEVEDVLRRHPDVADVAAFGVDDREYGERVAAWVVPRGDGALDPETLRAFCRGHIADYKVPRELRVVRELPLTANGKVQRFRMREETQRSLAAARTAAERSA